MSQSDQETLRISDKLRVLAPGRLRLVVLGEGLFSAHALPLGGDVVVGRGDEADIRIDDRSISRKHAVLHVGEPLRLEDLGSANGTRVRERKLGRNEVVTVAPGDVVEVGTVVLVVQRDAPGATAAGPADAGDPTPERPQAGPPEPSGPPFLVLDEAMQRLHKLVERIAPSRINVLLLGETGVGKEVIAGELHRLSGRARGPFLKLNCASLSETLLESELFGHEKGAFTGAVKTKAGLFETAAGGTVLLDEVGELPQSIQARLLRVLEDRQVLRVGAVKTEPIDVRFVFATNRDLEAEVARGTFREDLYYRLNGISVVIPPLRDRPAEIEPLARGFAAEAARRDGREAAPALSVAGLDALRSFAWPGNIRELRNVMERAVLLCGDGPIAPEHLGLGKAKAAPPSPGDAPNLKGERDAAERRVIVEALEKCSGNQTKAAKMLGISRRTLVARVQAYGLGRQRKDKAKGDAGG